MLASGRGAGVASAATDGQQVADNAAESGPTAPAVGGEGSNDLLEADGDVGSTVRAVQAEVELGAMRTPLRLPSGASAMRAICPPMLALHRGQWDGRLC